MKKLLFPMLAILMFTAGCTCGGNQPPTAYIDSILPAEASYGVTVTFNGHGTDPDGNVVAYRWRSNIDGDLSTMASFESLSLSEGEHTIYLKVQDDNGAWSEEVRGTLVVASASVAPPVISYFTASPGSISSGESSTLSWDVYNATTVSIDHGVGNVDLTGTTAVTPSMTTTYTLIATNEAGSVTATTGVTVSATEPSSPAGPPVINFFTAEPASIALGESSTLSWSVSNVESAMISYDSLSNTVAPSGSIIATLYITTTYTLTATNAAGSVSETAIVVVGEEAVAEPPVINSFTADPESITAGGYSTLSWNVSNATVVALEYSSLSESGSDQVYPVGTMTVSPRETTEYTLTAWDEYPGGVSVEQTVQVLVEAAPAEEHTVTLYLKDDESGYVNSDGDVGASKLSGDNAGNGTIWAYFSFDITGLAGADVTDARLTFTTMNIVHNPWPDLVTLGIYVYDYGPRPLRPDDFTFVGPAIVEGLTSPPGEVDATGQVQGAVAAGNPRFQVRLNFVRTTDSDDLADYIMWNTATLTVTYMD
jgi:hypothetical protein